MNFLNENNHMLFVMQFALAVVLVGAWLYMIVMGKVPPDSLNSLVTLVLGFFFGSQVTEMVTKGNREQ